MKKKLGFTLVELLIVIGTLAFLAVVTVLILNPPQFIAQGKDSIRMNDLQNLNKAIDLSKARGSFVDNTNEKRVYISLPDINNILNDDCRASGEYPTLPALASGWQYRCIASSANLRKIDGNGWIPINFTSVISIQPPFVILPIDPINTITNLNYYTYGWNTDRNIYALAVKLDSDKYLSYSAANDGGNDNTAFETRPIAWIPAPWACGDTVTFTYKGSSVTYGTVSSTGSKCWIDRNLGASRVATAYNDSNAYGDLFQWGRLDDGHQTRTSGSTETLSSTDNPGHSNFIKSPDHPRDWRSPQNNNLWQGVSGINNLCPSGWRIPTSTELNAERASWSQQNYNGAYASPLKLTAAGYRAAANAWFYYVDSRGFYWTGIVDTTGASNLGFTSANAGMNGYSRAHGFSVRCLKD